MERNRDIRLNPELPAADIKEGGGGNRIPLSDRYGIPVFAVETSRKEWELDLLLSELKKGTASGGPLWAVKMEQSE